MAMIGQFSGHEPDGDSVFGALLPNVYVSRVTLESISQAEGKTYQNPHLSNDSTYMALDLTGNEVVEKHMTSTEVLQQQNQAMMGYASQEPTSGMKVGVDLVFKEKVEPDDVSLFTIDRIVNSLKLRIVMSTDVEATKQILYAGKYSAVASDLLNIFPDLPGAGTGGEGLVYSYDQKQMATYLSSGDIIQDSLANPHIQYKTVDLKDIAQFNGLFGIAGQNSPEDKFLLNMDKEVLPDATVLYNIPYCVEDFEVAAAEGGTSANHVSIFAVTYVDFDEITKDASGNTQNVGQFVFEQKDQLQALNYDMETNVADSLQTAMGDLVKFFAEYGVGTPVKNHVIINGQIQNSNVEYVYVEGVKKGKAWFGPIHYHGPYNPAPDGYVGWMGGEKEHMGDPTKSKPKLKQVNVDSTGQISDYRTTHELNQLFFDYSGYGTGLTFQELVNPTPPESEKNAYATSWNVKDKLTLSNSWLSREKSPVFSDLYCSLHSNGESSFVFSFDAEQALRYNTAFPGLCATLKKTDPSGYGYLVSVASILGLHVTRKKVREFTDESGNHFLNEDQIPTSIVLSKDSGGTLKNSNLSLGKSVDVLGQGTQSGNGSNGSIKEISLLTNNNHVRHFSVTDSEIANHDEGVFQYSVEIEMKDPIVNYLNVRIAAAKIARTELENYLQLATSKPTYYNKHSNMFTKEFVSLMSNGNIGTAYASFLSTPVWKSVENFYENVLTKLKDMNGFSKSPLDIKMDMMTFTSPLYGSPTGIQSVLDIVSLVEKSLQDLVDSVSSHKSKKSTLSGENTLEVNLSPGPSLAQNSFKLKNVFQNAFDSNADAKSGYEYIFPSKTISGDDQESGLWGISLSDYLKRVIVEKQKFDMPNSFDSLGTLGTGIDHALPAYMTPLAAKIPGKEWKLDSALSGKEKTDITIDIIQHNNMNTAQPESLQFSDLGYLGVVEKNYLDVKNSRAKIPNMMHVLGQAGVSLEEKGSNRNKLISPSVASPHDIQTASGTKNIDYYQQYSKKVFGPDSAVDASSFLIYLLLMKETGLLSQAAYDSYNLYDTDGSYNKNSSIGQYLSFYSKLPISGQFEKAMQKMPNQVKTLLNNIASNNMDKKLFEKYTSLIEIVLRYRNIMRVEILTGYNTTVKDGTQMKSPEFKLLTSDRMDKLLSESDMSGQRVLARLMPYPMGDFRQPESMKMPVFNEYFFINLSATSFQNFSIEEEAPAEQAEQAKVDYAVYAAEKKVSTPGEGPSAETEEGGTSAGMGGKQGSKDLANGGDNDSSGTKKKEKSAIDYS